MRLGSSLNDENYHDIYFASQKHCFKDIMVRNGTNDWDITELYRPIETSCKVKEIDYGE